MQNDSPERSIARCQIFVRDAQRCLEAAREYNLSDSLLDVVNRLPQLSSTFRRQDQEISDLSQRLASERQALDEARQRESALLDRVKRREDTIKEHLTTIRTLTKDLQTATTNGPRQYEKGFKAGQEAEKNRQNQPDSDFEDLIRRQLNRGSEKFKACDFAGALILLKEAQSSILSLPAPRRPLFDNTKLRYQMAICGAYVNDLVASEKSLSGFGQATFSTASSREEMLNLAHAQHLLAQVYIGQNRIQDAQSTCKHSNEIRWQYLKSTDNRRYQSAALSARLVELQGQRGASLLREAILESSVRDALKEAYSKLKPLKAGENPKNDPYFLSEPATELLPIWTMKTKAKQPANNSPNTNNQDKSKPPKATFPPTVPLANRTEWLARLKLSSNDGEFLDPSLEQAIRSSDAQKVSQILTTARAVAPALHMAALFNDVQIATILLKHNPALARMPCAGRTDTDKHQYGVLPMHLAIGAQHPAMIRLLHSYGADLRATTALSSKKRVCAPPLYLVSERWLSMTGKSEPASVIEILELLRELGWKKRDKVNQDDDTVETLVEKQLKYRPELKGKLVQWLNSVPS